MGIFSRLSEIINSNVNAMLDKAEDPEKMVRLMISEMEDTLIEIKSSAAAVLADRMRLERGHKSHADRAAEWDAKTQLAIDKGRDDLARAAIEQKFACEQEADRIQGRLTEIDNLAKQYQTDIQRLEEKMHSAKSRQKIIIANHQSAVNRRRVEEQIHRINNHGAFARFDNYQERIDRFQAEAEILATSNNTLEKEFDDLARDNSVEDELTRMKSKMNASKSAGSKSDKKTTAAAS